MLNPITKKVTEESDGNAYRFTFYCDICGNPWHSIPYHSDISPSGGEKDAHEREREHIAAYERANREALMHFNRCPVCKRMVCDECFRILPERDMCKECVSEQQKIIVK